MAFNGSGTFVRLYNWVNHKAANIKVRADRMDAEMDGMATGLSTCLTKDGQTTVTANLPMANFRHTGVGNATARTDYAAAGQVQDGKLNWVAAGGTSDAITATYSPAITALVDGQICCVRAGAANTTTTPTFSPNTLTARTITKNGNQALVAGDIYGSGHELILRYRLSDTKWELLNPAGISIPYTLASASGAASLAFAEDADNGSNKVTLKAPASIASDVDITLPGVASTLATLAGTETLSGKTLDTATVVTTQTTGDNSTKISSTAFLNAMLAPLMGVTGFLPSSIAGNATTAAMTISAGAAASSAGAGMIIKSTSSSWAVSNGNAALGYQGGTTLPNSDTIHLFACSGGSGTTIFAHNGLTPTPPAGYNTYYRRIGCFNTTGAGAPIAFTAYELGGGEIFNELIAAVSQTTSVASTGTTVTLGGIPTDIVVRPIFRITSPVSSVYAIVNSLNVTSIAPGVDGTAPGVSVEAPGAQVPGFPFVMTNTSAQVRARSSATNNFYFYVDGWVDSRR